MAHDEVGQITNNPEINTYGSGPDSKTINGPNDIGQQPSHGDDNPKFKNMGSDMPSRPREDGDTNRGMSDKDYKSPDIRKNSYYGPIEASNNLTNSLKEAPKGNQPPDGFSTWEEYQQDLRDKYAIDRLERDLNASTDKDIQKESSHEEALDSNKKANEVFNNLKPLSTTDWTPEDIKKIQALTEQSVSDRANKLAQEEKQKSEYSGDKKPEDKTPDIEPIKLNPEVVEPSEIEKKITNMEAQIVELNTKLELLLEKLNGATPITSYDSKEPQEIAIIDNTQELATTHSDDIIDAEFMEVGETSPVQNENDTVTVEQARKDRRTKRNVMIAGAATGFGAVIVGGTAIVPVAGAVVIGTQLAAFGTRKFAEWREVKLNDRLLGTTNPEERAKIENRVNKWKKVERATERVKQFFRGASYGVLAGSFVSGVFMGGEGIVDKIAHAQASSAENIRQVATGTHADATATANSQVRTPDITNAEIPTTPGVPTPEVQLGDWFDTSKYGWDWQNYGWKGSRLALGGNGGTEGIWQGNFVKSLFENGVNDQMLSNPEAGQIFSSALRSVYQGGDPTQIGQTAAEQIINLVK